MGGIFEGVRVLDFTNAVSGPTLTRLMAEMGADVIKVELPPTGDLGRNVPAVVNGRSGFFVQQNRGKRSVFLDVKDPRGRELALELDRIRERNKQLMLLVERERIQRFREQQRKVLELEPSDSAGGDEKKN